jgi:hypothetical protein
MKQSKFMSMLETTLSTAFGFGFSLLAQWLVLPWLLGIEIPLHTNIAFALIMTLVSLARGFILRRLFEALHIRRPLSAFAQAAIAERYRQIDVEGWEASHDDAHPIGEMGLAGAAYALGVRYRAQGVKSDIPPVCWPWEASWWKPRDDRRDLVRAAALLIAEGERHDRARKTRAV